MKTYHEGDEVEFWDTDSRRWIPGVVDMPFGTVKVNGTDRDVMAVQTQQLFAGRPLIVAIPLERVPALVRSAL